MATTLTASLAYATVQPKANHFGNRIAGTHAVGAISASGSGMALLAVVPPNATNVQLLVRHNSGGETALVMNYGYRTENASLSASAFISSLADVTTMISAPVNFTRDEANYERRRFITATKVSGTAGASTVINYQITYDFYTSA